MYAFYIYSANEKLTLANRTLQHNAQLTKNTKSLSNLSNFNINYEYVKHL